jgi:hypothetical protein
VVSWTAEQASGQTATQPEPPSSALIHSAAARRLLVCACRLNVNPAVPTRGVNQYMTQQSTILEDLSCC